MPKRLTQSEIEDRLLKFGVTMLEPYKGSNSLIMVRGECGHTWKAYPGIITSRKRAGCWTCSYIERGLDKRMTQEDAASAFSVKGITLLSQYLGSACYVDVQCDSCLHKWKVRPNNVFSINDSGCPKCSGRAPVTPEEAKDRFEKRGMILLSDYTDSHTDVRARCLKFNHPWEGKPYHIFNGGGCPNCAPYGFQTDRPAILYYIYIPVMDLYKIGITNRTVKKRFGRFFFHITLLRIKHFALGMDAYLEEQETLTTYQEDLYTGPHISGFGGKNELFTRDILGLHTKEAEVAPLLL